MFYSIHYGLSNMEVVKAKLPVKTRIVDQNKDRGWVIVESPAEWELLLRAFKGTEILVGIDHTHDKKVAS